LGLICTGNDDEEIGIKRIVRRDGKPGLLVQNESGKEFLFHNNE